MGRFHVLYAHSLTQPSPRLKDVGVTPVLLRLGSTVYSSQLWTLRRGPQSWPLLERGLPTAQAKPWPYYPRLVPRDPATVSHTQSLSGGCHLFSCLGKLLPLGFRGAVRISASAAALLTLNQGPRKGRDGQKGSGRLKQYVGINQLPLVPQCAP